jgi:hypothetical protein
MIDQLIPSFKGAMRIDINARFTERKRRCPRLHRRTAHPAPQIRVDGQIEELDEDTSVERDVLEVDGVCGIVDGCFPGFWIAYDGEEKWVRIS